MLLVKDLRLLTGKSVNLELNDGESYVLQGANGSGKTVLLRTLAGLYEGTFSTFLFQGKSFDEYQMEEFRAKILYTGSSTSFPPEMTSEEFLAAPLKLEVYRGFKSDFSPEKYLEKWELKGKKLGHLSSGQKQLLSLLRTLSLKGELLLLDEPTSHMDSVKTREAESLLLDWKKKNPTGSLLIISHSEEQAARLGKRIQFSEILITST